MQGHVRRRGKDSWEYIADIGMHEAERCQSCRRRFWIERRPREICPKCGGRLIETEERRRLTKAGFATRGAAQGAMSKVLVAVEERSFVAPSKLSLREYLKIEWLPAIEATIRPSSFRAYKQHVECHICPHLGSVPLQKLSGAQINALYAKLALTGKQNGKSGLSPLSIRHVHATFAPGAQGRGALGAPHAEPGRRGGPAEHQRRWQSGTQDLERRAAEGVPRLDQG